MAFVLTANVTKLTNADSFARGDFLADFQTIIRDWVRASWRRARPGEEFSVPVLSELTGIPLPALYRIEKLRGRTSDRIIKKIAETLGAPLPSLTLDVSGLSERSNPLWYIGEAQAALEQAASLLRGQPTEQQRVAAEVKEEVALTEGAKPKKRRKAG